MTWLCAARTLLVLLFAAAAALLVAVHWTERGPSPHRRLERVCLVAVSLPLLGWLAFVYYARAAEFADFARRVAQGEIADLRTVRGADAVEFLLSDRARWITGQQIIVDGGRTVDMSLK